MHRGLERQKLKDIREGRREACEALVCEHYESIYNFMVYLTNNVSIAEDLTQETFLAAWANADSFKGRASFKTWLHKIAYHKFIDSKRKLERHLAMISNLKEEKADVSSETSTPLCKLKADESWRLLYEAMNKLQSSEYLLIVLHYIQGLSFCEMANVLDEPTGTVKWRNHRALKRLKVLLTGGA
ncbi:MAG: RNA polymerase sigma factor [Planctomycetota bacterium]